MLIRLREFFKHFKAHFEYLELPSNFCIIIIFFQKKKKIQGHKASPMSTDCIFAHRFHLLSKMVLFGHTGFWKDWLFYCILYHSTTKKLLIGAIN